MARKKIREWTAKTLLRAHHKALPSTFAAVQVTANTDWAALEAKNPWLATAALVVKPDMLFGQRGKHNLVAFNLNLSTAKEFIAERLGKVIEIDSPALDEVTGQKKKIRGAITHFIVERMVPHDYEYYVSFQSMRESTSVALSAKGGVEVEENWDAVMRFDVAVGAPLTLTPEQLAAFPPSHRFAVERFLVESFRVFEDLDFTMMEFNPFCVVESNDAKLESADPHDAGLGTMVAIPLDMRGEVDDTANFKNQRKWMQLLDTFPHVFGHENCEAEEFVASLDAQTGASLKLTVLNPAGRLWLLVAGGGASVIYTDTVCDLGHSDILGNYGEYSGNPSDEMTNLYARTVIQAATRLDETNPKLGRCLVIGGGVANFTDVKATFQGIAHALLEHSAQLKACDMKIYVRRGGPNYEAALQMMKEIEAGVGVSVEVFGPDTHMTKIVHLASEYLQEYDNKNQQ